MPNIPTPHDLEGKRDEMIRQLSEYRDQVAQAFDAVVTALSNGEYATACSVMSTISAHQAQASVRMRAVLVKNGFMVREREGG
jgi:hypothetical protein